MLQELKPAECKILSFDDLKLFGCSVAQQSEKASLRYLSSKMVAEYIMKSDDNNVDVLHTDVISKVYEGGLQIWECTFHMLDYLVNHSINFTDKVVLDLGCGSGLLGIYAGLHNAKEIHFLDFNKYVLEYFTYQNVRMNEVKCDVKYYFGDWSSFTNSNHRSDGTVDVSYDVILTSETVYDAENFASLCDVLIKRLKPDGVIYLIAKMFYFGMNGGTVSFRKYISDNSLKMKSESIWKSTEGVRCELLRITLEKDTEIQSESAY